MNAQSKTRYALDENNTLLVKRQGKRQSVPGYFSVDSRNRLIYHINKPSAWKKVNSFPEKILFKGTWQLNQNHDLVCLLDETKTQSRNDRLVIKGEIMNIEKDCLAFSCHCVNAQGILGIRLLKLSGVLRTDGAEKIEFMVSRNAERGVLHFRGDWHLNAGQQIAYVYEKQVLKTKTKITRTLEFKGFWKIVSAHKIVYIISDSSLSRLDFKVFLESPSLYPEDKVIKYRIGAGSSSKTKLHAKTVSLYGEWKFSRKANVEFEMKYRNNKLYRLVFGSKVLFNQNNELALTLTDEQKKPLGAQLILTRRFLKKADAAWFLRLKHSQKEKELELGLRIPF